MMRALLSFLFIVLLLPAVATAQSTATVADTSTDATIGNVEAQLKGTLGTLFAKIEPWRVKQAAHFTALRDRKKAELGIDSAKDVYDALTPDAPEAPAAPGTPQEEQDLADLQNDYQGIDLAGYGIYIYAMALATIFSSVALFYITGILLALFVLRMIIRLFR
jgi:hypothetical protein